MVQLDLLIPDALPAAARPSLPHDPLPTKASGAYKTIREVSEEIDVPQHVLRFWESRFPQVKPSRMRGSRRYYRPEDVETLKTIKTLLYNQGFTINGAKQVVRGKQPVADASAPLPQAIAPVPLADIADAPGAASVKPIDTKMLISELRVLKSMLMALL